MNLDIDRILLIAEARINVTECPPNTNSGKAVEAYQATTGNRRGDAWCASFVADCGKTAYGAVWPLPLSGYVQSLYVWADKRKLITTAPVRGSVFLIWHPELSRFAHTGFCLDDAGATIEGNTSGGGVREGWGVFSRVRKWAAEDRFISGWWTI